MMSPDIKVFTLFSSSKGNCTYIKYGSDEILIDAGASATAIEASLSSLGSSLSNIKGILVTHEHSDHVKGLEVISKRFHVPVYMSEKSEALVSINAPTAADNAVLIDSGDELVLGDIGVKVFDTPHDSVKSLCFRIELGNKTLGFATDLGHVSDSVQDAVFGADGVIIESNHDEAMLRNGPYPYHLKERILGKNGHLSNSSCAALLPALVRCGAKGIVLAHLSENNNTPFLAYRQSAEMLRSYGVKLSGEEFAADACLRVAEVKSPTELFI